MIHWAGIAKLQEEMAELSVELSKLHAAPDGNHWDNKYKGPLIQRVHAEIGDVMAALAFFCETNVSERDHDFISARADVKLSKFRGWHKEEGMTGTKAPLEPSGAQSSFIVNASSRGCGHCLACQDGVDCFRVR